MYLCVCRPWLINLFETGLHYQDGLLASYIPAFKEAGLSGKRALAYR